MRRFAQAIADADSLPPGLPGALASAVAAAPDRYNIGKGSLAAVLACAPDGTPALADMVWGLVPRWSKAPSTPYTTVTARLERAPRSRIYAQAWARRRCMVPMTGYYKWDRQRRPPWPLFVQRQDGLALLAAGLWEHWENEDGLAMDSFSVLTAPSPAIPAPLTADGPVFVDAAIALDWLAGGLDSPAALRQRARTPRLAAYPVGRAFRDPARDDYTLLEPVAPDDADPHTQPPDWDGDAMDELEDDD